MNDLFGDEEFSQHYEINSYTMSSMTLQIREFSFHRLNGNQVWPGNQVFADFLFGQLDFLRTQNIVELGSGSGILGIFLARLGARITVSDCPDSEIFENIDFNCKLNGIDSIPKLPREIYIRYVGRIIA